MTTRTEILDSFLDDIVEEIQKYAEEWSDEDLDYSLEIELDEEGNTSYYADVKGTLHFRFERTEGDCYLIPDYTERTLRSQYVDSCIIYKYVGGSEEQTFDITREVENALDKFLFYDF